VVLDGIGAWDSIMLVNAHIIIRRHCFGRICHLP
jgi:hypothetical protein